jgi:hypothetical protein
MIRACIAWAVLLALSAEVSSFCPPGGFCVNESSSRVGGGPQRPQIRGKAPVAALRRNRQGRARPVMTGSVDGGTEASSTVQVQN